MSTDNGNKTALTRRHMLAKLGLAATALYAAPVMLQLSHAHASGASGGGSSGGGGSGQSGGSGPSGPSGSSRSARPGTGNASGSGYRLLRRRKRKGARRSFS